jgi:tRNA(Ile)-lysidine synthase
MIKEIFKDIKNHKLIKKGETIILGFSGGPDSVFLLEILKKYKEEIDSEIEIILVHINHMLRGEDSDGDEKFSESIAKKNSFKFYSKKINITKISIEEKKGLEEIGREVRHQLFKEIFEKEGGDKIALAHNKDDQIETFLFRLIRGTSLEGLEGIRMKKMQYIRPIINVFKKEILKYLSENKIEYRVDKTNFENEFTRNSIRLDLIPFIEKRYNPKFKDKIFNIMGEVREVNAENSLDIEEFMENSKLSIEKLNTVSDFFKKKLIKQYFNEKNIKSDRYKVNSVIELLEKGGSKRISLEKDIFLLKEYNYLSIIKEVENQEVKKNLFEKNFELKIPGKIKFGSYEVIAEVSLDKIEKGSFEFLTNLNIGETLIVRTRKNGDKIIPTGMTSEKKVKEILINNKILKEKREELPLVLQGDKIIWIGGVRGSEIFKKDCNTKESIKLLIRRIQ